MDLNGITERKNVSLDNFPQNWKKKQKKIQKSNAM